MSQNETKGNEEKVLKMSESSSFITLGDLSELLGLPPAFIYEHTRKGSKDPIPSFRFGKHLRFSKIEIKEWIERHRKRQR